MAAQTLTWGPSSYGNFVEAAQWLPREAPTPNVGQTLNILGGGLSLYSAPLDDYTFNLLPGSTTSSLYLNDQVIDAETLIRQTAPSAYMYGYGTVTNFGEMQLGTTGVATATTLRLAQGATFRNTGPIDVSGTLVVDSFAFAPGPAGTFQNNGTLSVNGGVVLINNLVPGQAGSNFTSRAAACSNSTASPTRPSPSRWRRTGACCSISPARPTRWRPSKASTKATRSSSRATPRPSLIKPALIVLT